MKTDVSSCNEKNTYKVVVDLAIAILINVLLIVLCVLVCKPYYETNDDLAMAQIASGARYMPNAHIVFINILIGKVLSELYLLLPGGSWYVWFQWSIVFVSLTIITYVFIRKMKTKAVLCPVIGVLLGMGYECYTAMQFTKTAAIATTAGAILIFYGIENWSKIAKRVEILLGSILAIIGSLYRFSAFEMVILIMVGIGVFRLGSLWDKDFKVFACNILQYIVPFMFVLFVAFGLEYVDVKAYADDGEWEAYTEFNDMRAELLDYGFPDYFENMELYNSLGISESDVDYYSRWQFGDTENFTTEIMRELIAAKGETKISFWHLRNVCESYFSKLFEFFGMGIFWVFLLVQVFFICQNEKNGIKVLIYEIVQTLAIYLYFVIIGRFGQRRIDVSYWMAVIAVVIFLMLDEKIEIKNLFSKMAITICAVIGIFFLNTAVMWGNVVNDVDEVSRDDAKLFFEEVARDNEHIYLATAGSSLESKAWGIKDTINRGCLNNYYSVGGWQNRSPVTNAVLESYNIYNPFREMINNETVYLIDNILPGRTEKYLKENYGEESDLVLVKYVLGNYIFRAYMGDAILDIASIVEANDEILYDVEIEQMEDGIYVSGYAFKKGTSSFAQNVYVEVMNDEGVQKYYPAVLLENENYDDVYYGRFSLIDQNLPGIKKENVVSVILETEGICYQINIED